jgi:hypothetical protein
MVPRSFAPDPLERSAGQITLQRFVRHLIDGLALFLSDLPGTLQKLRLDCDVPLGCHCGLTPNYTRPI